MPWLTPETFAQSSDVDKIKCYANNLTDEEKLTLMKAWINPMVEKAQRRLDNLAAIQEAL